MEVAFNFDHWETNMKGNANFYSCNAQLNLAASSKHTFQTIWKNNVLRLKITKGPLESKI